jgi:hypothetical protein
MKNICYTLPLTALTIILSGCALPKPHLTQTRTYTEFLDIVSSPPQFQWAYCGSDLHYHYFAQWRYGAMLLHTGRSSYLKSHKVPRNEMTIKDEFQKTNNMDDWRIYSLMGGDRDGSFSTDFLHNGDKVKPAIYE